jgi:D-alanine-D-alanine ligase
MIVKPLNEDASIGIDTHSIVEAEASLIERVRFVWDEFRQPSLPEEFIDGRELNVAVLAVAPERFMTLPISEVLFRGFPGLKYHILTYEAKWMVDSPYYSSTVPRCPAELSPELAGAGPECRAERGGGRSPVSSGPRKPAAGHTPV